MAQEPYALSGRKFGNYRIEKEIARGGFGSVYLAQHEYLTERRAVIKLLQGVYLSEPQEREGFIREAQILERLKHPHILPIYDVGIENEQPYIIAEYAPNGTLRERIARQNGNPLSLETTLAILAQIAAGLQHAHNQHVIHRDLKPENILFNARDEALLADFGISTVLTSATVKQTREIGTPTYMAPEQFTGMVSVETDQYALACIAYELLSGRKAFAGTTNYVVMQMQMQQYPQRLRELNPAVPEYVENVIFRALGKERTQRFADVRTFMEALKNPNARLQAAPAINSSEPGLAGMRYEQGGAPQAGQNTPLATPPRPQLTPPYNDAFNPHSGPAPAYNAFDQNNQHQQPQARNAYMPPVAPQRENELEARRPLQTGDYNNQAGSYRPGYAGNPNNQPGNIRRNDNAYPQTPDRGYRPAPQETYSAPGPTERRQPATPKAHEPYAATPQLQQAYQQPAPGANMRPVPSEGRGLAALAYVPFVCIAAWIYYFFTERSKALPRFHVVQGFQLYVILIALTLLNGWLQQGMIDNKYNNTAVFNILEFLHTVTGWVFLAFIVLGIIAIISALFGTRFRIPFIGGRALRYSNRG
ncbi:hypothetical protein KSC_076290 [Ktedonobacter sp. SOSP1-52]|uniref:serine/threonine-protein kinase n=1 Tax=Ktedonobacter sp. SOSP1-52 TaxID=2778366 RepID=UPI001915352B|nr:serine/threonine-protein kinase [Ktedonobacter sp. SOSP1-52]GHO68737.1 hypothetical protein KSC_076290 [Ktedonobacter sp. SOSP1-52]